MKLKVIKFKSEEVETKYELPVFLCTQDEMCYDTLVKIEESDGGLTKMTVTFTHNSVVISKDFNAIVHEFYDKDVTTESHFKIAHETALNSLK